LHVEAVSRDGQDGARLFVILVSTDMSGIQIDEYIVTPTPQWNINVPAAFVGAFQVITETGPRRTLDRAYSALQSPLCGRAQSASNGATGSFTWPSGEIKRSPKLPWPEARDSLVVDVAARMELQATAKFRFARRNQNVV
jgi:hypothetical protein